MCGHFRDWQRIFEDEYKFITIKEREGAGYCKMMKSSLQMSKRQELKRSTNKKTKRSKLKYKEAAFTSFAAELLYEIHTKLANIEDKQQKSTHNNKSPDWMRICKTNLS